MQWGPHTPHVFTWRRGRSLPEALGHTEAKVDTGAQETSLRSHNRWPTATEGWGRSMELDTDLCDRDHVPKLTLTAKYSRSLYVCRPCTCIPALLPRSSVLFMSVRTQECVRRPYTWGGVKTTNHAPKRRYDDDSDCHLKIRSEAALPILEDDRWRRRLHRKKPEEEREGKKREQIARAFGF
jgi:hypothetical protein